jgi:hydrogenase/urease accessory protein HupE
MSVGYRAMLLFVGLIWSASAARAHELRPAYLELRQTAAETFDVLWKVPAAGENLRLALYVCWPEGWVNLTEPRGTITGGAYLERWQVRVPNGSVDKRITIDGLASTMTDVLVRVEKLDGTTQVVRLMPANPSFEVAASPSRWEVVWTYVMLGVEHIMLGVDHLLFVLGLLLIVQGRMLLLKTITAFTVAHSITLGVATLGYASAPLPPLNVAIALSILFLGPEIVRSWRGETSLTIRYPWLVAFAFGLLHGFGFASGLSITGIPHTELPLALLSFNIGVELGQLGFVVMALLLAKSFRVLDMQWPVWALRAPGYVVGTSGAYWTIQRTVMLFGE